TPLGVMMGNEATIKSGLAKLAQEADPAKQEKFLSTMNTLLNHNQHAAERIQTIVKNLRNFARLDESDAKSIDIHEGIESTLALMADTWQKQGVTIQKNFGADLPKLLCFPGL